MYEVEIDKKACDFLNKLPEGIRARIIQKIENSSYNPYHYFSRLSGRSDYKLKVGDYRVIANIDSSSSKILVRFIGHRKNVYERTG